MHLSETEDGMKKTATSLVEKVLRYAVSKLFVERLLTNAKLVVTDSSSPQETTSLQSYCSNTGSQNESDISVHVSEKVNFNTDKEGRIVKNQEQFIDRTAEAVTKNVDSPNSKIMKKGKSISGNVKPEQQSERVGKSYDCRGDSDVTVDNRSNESRQSARHLESVPTKRKKQWNLNSEGKNNDRKQKETAASEGTYDREKSTVTSKRRRALRQRDKSDQKSKGTVDGREISALSKSKVNVASKKDLVDTKENAKTGKNRRSIPMTLLPKNGTRKTRPLNDEKKESCTPDKVIAVNERKISNAKAPTSMSNSQGQCKKGWIEHSVPQPKRVWTEQSKHSVTPKSTESTAKEHKGTKKCLSYAVYTHCDPVVDICLKNDPTPLNDAVSQHGSLCNDTDGASSPSFTSVGSLETLPIPNDSRCKVIQDDIGSKMCCRMTETNGKEGSACSTPPLKIQPKKNDQKSSLLKSFARDRVAEKNGLSILSGKVDNLEKEENNNSPFGGKGTHFPTEVYSYNLNGGCQLREKPITHVQQNRSTDLHLNRPKVPKQWKAAKTSNSCIITPSAVPVPPYGKSKNSYTRLKTNLLSIDERGLDLRSVPVSSKPVAHYWRKSSIFNRVYTERDKRATAIHKPTNRLPNLLSTSQRGVYSEKEQFVCCSRDKEGARKHSSDSDGRISETFSEDSGYETVPSLKDPKTKEVKGRERFMKFSLTKASRNMSIIEEEKYKGPCYQILSNERRKRSIAYDKKRRSKSLWQLQNAKKSKENRRKTIQLVIAENGSTKF